MRRVKRRYLIAVGMAVAAGAAIALAITVTGSGGAAPGIFRTVSSGKLAAGGITLSAPHGSIPTSSAGEAAASAASQAFGGNKVREYHYAYCVDTQKVPALAQDCWAVSLDPSGYGGGGTPHTGPASPATYLLVLVDPSDDAVLDGQSD